MISPSTISSTLPVWDRLSGMQEAPVTGMKPLAIVDCGINVFTDTATGICVSVAVGKAVAVGPAVGMKAASVTRSVARVVNKAVLVIASEPGAREGMNMPPNTDIMKAPPQIIIPISKAIKHPRGSLKGF
jgi:hypothetical protein